jgi:hypothetical protein
MLGFEILPYLLPCPFIPIIKVVVAVMSSGFCPPSFTTALDIHLNLIFFIEKY